jgi:hypothetical protein
MSELNEHVCQCGRVCHNPIPKPDYTMSESDKKEYYRYIKEAADFRKKQSEPVELFDLTLPCDEELVPYNPPTFDTAFLF